MADTPSIAPIDSKLKELEELIRANEAEAARIENEGEELRTRLGALQDAKRVVLRELGVEGASQVDLLMPSATGGAAEQSDDGGTLKARTLQLVRESVSKDGLSASEVTRALAAEGEGTHVTPRVFYSMVYLTLMRLTETGELKFKKGEKGRRFYAPPARSTS